MGRAIRRVPIILGLCLLVTAGSALPARAARGGSLARARAAKIADSPHALAVDPRTGRVFATGYRIRGVAILSATSGAILRTVATDASAAGVAVDERTGHVFVANRGPSLGAAGSVSMIDQRDGRVLHTTRIDMNPTVLTVDQATGRVFVVNRLGLVILDARTGLPVRTVLVGGYILTPVAIDARSGHAFAVSSETNMFGRPLLDANNLYMLDAGSGALLRTIPDPHIPIAVSVDSRRERVFVANEDGSISIFDARTGLHTGTLRLPAPALPGALAVDEQTCRLFVSADGRSTAYLFTLDECDGAFLGTRAVGNYTFTVAVVARAGRVFVTSNTGVYAFDARSGARVGMAPMSDGPDSVAVDAAHERVYVSTGMAVGMLDARSGALLRMVALR